MSHHELYVRSVMADRLRDAEEHRRRRPAYRPRHRPRARRRGLVWRPRVA
jgi:hypothetical protein